VPQEPALALAQPVKPKFKERTKAVRRPAHWSRIGFTMKPMRLQWAGLRTALVRSLNLGLTGCASASAG
jgi:hypothetical protein